MTTKKGAEEFARELRADMTDDYGHTGGECIQGCGQPQARNENTCGMPDCNFNFLVAQGKFERDPDVPPREQAPQIGRPVTKGPTGQLYIWREGWKRIG